MCCLLLCRVDSKDPIINKAVVDGGYIPALMTTNRIAVLLEKKRVKQWIKNNYHSESIMSIIHSLGF